LDGNQYTKSESSTQTSYTYDGLGRLVSEEVTTPVSKTARWPFKTPSVLGDKEIITTGYAYDDAGNRSYKTTKNRDNEAVTSYEYDLNNRLLQETKASGAMTATSIYAYDSNGNQLSSRQWESELPGKGTAWFAFLPLRTPGKTQERAASSGNPESEKIEHREYDVFNRLTEVSGNTTEAAYSYRPDGLRYCKTVNGEITTHIWDGSNIVAELGERRTLKDRYIRGVGLVKNGQDEYFAFNGHGDTVRLVNSDGNISKRYDYDSFGVEVNPDEDDTNPWRYAGEYCDIETNTYYLRARIYNPSNGRFLSEDPIRHGLNWYTYVSNNPIRFIDPWGLREVG
jgi:RHS repeat-associated protein